MKRMFSTLLVLIMAVAAFAAFAASSYSHNANVLPAQARTTLKSHFKADVSVVKTEKTLGRITEYEVILTDGTEISFDSKGQWKDVEVSERSQVPTAIVPQAILSYVERYHKGARVVGIEKTSRGYDIELSNSVDMKFKSDGTFRCYDD